MKLHANYQEVKIRYINPLGIPNYDQGIADCIREIKAPQSLVEVVSLKMENSPHDLEYYSYEGLVNSGIVRVTRDAAEKGFDAVVIGCFYDPVLREAREISGQAAVVGPCEASLTVICNLCNRFSIIVGREKWVGQMEENVWKYGYHRKLASFQAIDMGVEEFQKYPEKTKTRMLEECVKAINQHKAEGIVLGCTIEYGFYDYLQKELGVPVIDCTVASYKYAEFHASLKQQFGWIPSRKWSFEAPPEEELKKYKIFSQPAPIGNSIWIKPPKDNTH